jgi:hypothetical protein
MHLRPPASAVALAALTAVTFAGGCAPPGALGAGSPSVQPAISPAPATPDASPGTQISILGVAPDRIESVVAVGAISGRHRGRLRAYSGGRGASFVPLQPFTPGETVSASVQIRGLRDARFRFTIARFARVPPVLPLAQVQSPKLDHFVSAPEVLSPTITVLQRDDRLPGDIFLTPLPSPVVHPGSSNVVSIAPVGPGGPMIIDGRGQLVWFRPLPAPEVAANLRVDTYGGRPVLTWWQGEVTAAAFGLGEGVITNASYRTVAVVRAGNGYAMDLHEFHLTPDGDALCTVYSPVLVHLPGTPAGATTTVMDSIAQEVDVRTGLVVWEWHALGHIPLADSYATAANSATYDAFHINALQPLAGGRVLVSARDTSAVYSVDRATGRIVWTLGGKASSFRLGPGARFFFQHDAEMQPDGRISLFDDEAGPPLEQPTSRGLILSLDLRRRIASVARRYVPAADRSAQSEGSLEPLPGGGAFLGFGSQPYFSQFSVAGRLLFDAQLPQDDGSYRAFRYAWSAMPRTRPAVVAHIVDPSHLSVFMSWNGATDVSRWQVLATGSRKVLETVRRNGFETQAVIGRPVASVTVRALSPAGRVLATSMPATVS